MTGRPALGLLVATGLATAACAGTEPAGGGPAPSFASTAARQLGPAEFAATVEDEDVVTVNVHVPNEGSIAGTDAAIPYDEIAARPGELPPDPGTPLAVYCRTGAMSAQAVATLRELGYTDVVELRGGMEAWTADGRELLPPAT